MKSFIFLSLVFFAAIAVCAPVDDGDLDKERERVHMEEVKVVLTFRFLYSFRILFEEKNETASTLIHSNKFDTHKDFLFFQRYIEKRLADDKPEPVEEVAKVMGTILALPFSGFGIVIRELIKIF